MTADLLSSIWRLGGIYNPTETDLTRIAANQLARPFEFVRSAFNSNLGQGFEGSRVENSHLQFEPTLLDHERRSCPHFTRKTNRGIYPKCDQPNYFQSRQQRKTEQRAGSRSCISAYVSVHAHLPNRLKLSAVVGSQSHKPPNGEGDEQGSAVCLKEGAA